MLKENFSHVYDKFKLLLYDKAFNDDGDDDALSAFEVICMEIITALKEPTVNAFADAAHMSSPNATYRVNSLIKKGYINKKRGETDRREYYLEATEKYTKTTVWSMTILESFATASRRDSQRRMSKSSTKFSK